MQKGKPVIVFGKHVYLDSMGKIVAFNYYDLFECFAILQTHIDTGAKGYFIGYLTYEAGVILQIHNKHLFKKLLNKILEREKAVGLPLAHFELFASRKKFSLQNATPMSEKDSNTTLFKPLKNLDKNIYKKHFQQVKRHLAIGDSYQVNYTQEIYLQRLGDLSNEDLFRSLCKQQNAPYKSFIKTDFDSIISLSPELFFKIKGRKITTQPMKGTIRRSGKDDIDKQLRNQLSMDKKSQSENVMIVDLLRNDLSRIPNIKKVKVKELFKVHTYPTLHQLVSTIEAKLPKNYRILDIFLALFPCGSITGAPKLRTLEIIESLENRRRGIYCGAIGLISRKKILFNVPIRTLVKYNNEELFRYGVGSGIVWDSKLNEELEELILKCTFLKIADQSNLS